MQKIIRYDHALIVCLLLAGCGYDRKGSAANAISPDSIGLHRDTATIVPDTVITGISTAEFQEAITPAEVLERFKAGNKRFLEGRMVHRNYLSQVDLSANGQHPFAVIVSYRYGSHLIKKTCNPWKIEKKKIMYPKDSDLY